MTDRTLPWGDPPDQNYTTGEGGSDPPDGNFVVAETSAGLKLMEWDATATEWVVRGDVNASGQAVTVDSLDATSVSTEEGLVYGTDIDSDSGSDISLSVGDVSELTSLKVVADFNISSGDSLECYLNSVDVGGDYVFQQVDGTVQTDQDVWTLFDAVNATAIGALELIMPVANGERIGIAECAAYQRSDFSQVVIDNMLDWGGGIPGATQQSWTINLRNIGSGSSVSARLLGAK